jgi:hypothetical protein
MNFPKRKVVINNPKYNEFRKLFPTRKCMSYYKIMISNSIDDLNNLTNTNIYGSVISLDVQPIDVSASDIRKLIHKYHTDHKDPITKQERLNTLINITTNMMQKQVVEYILEQNLYT